MKEENLDIAAFELASNLLALLVAEGIVSPDKALACAKKTQFRATEKSAIGTSKRLDSQFDALMITLSAARRNR